MWGKEEVVERGYKIERPLASHRPVWQLKKSSGNSMMPLIGQSFHLCSDFWPKHTHTHTHSHTHTHTHTHNWPWLSAETVPGSTNVAAC